MASFSNEYDVKTEATKGLIKKQDEIIIQRNKVTPDVKALLANARAIIMDKDTTEDECQLAIEDICVSVVNILIGTD